MAGYKFIEPTGVIVPDTSDTLAKVEQEWRDIFGADLVTSPETPQGALITADALLRDGVVRAMSEVANQINPALAGGVFLDALSSMLGVYRHGATHSHVASVTVTGVAGTVIPAASEAKTANGDIFISTRQVVIGQNGQATVDFIAKESGAIACGIGELNTIEKGVLGLETVLNDAPAVIGTKKESDEALRIRRKLTLAANSISTNEAIISRLYTLDGVQSLSYRENASDFAEVEDGVTIEPRSIYVCINGGADIEIAKALKATKTLGAGYSGSEEVTIIDDFSNQPYTVKFDRPTPIDIYTKVTVRQGAGNASTITRQAYSAFVAGEIEGEQGVAVGHSISPFEIAAAINSYEPSIFIMSVELSLDNENWSTATQEILLNEIAHMPLGFLTVVVS